MKKILILTICLSMFSFSKSFVDKNFNAKVYEVNIINGVKKEKTYDLNYTIEKAQIKVLAPKLNEGEIYTYTVNEKTSYYPLLKQTVVTKLDSDEQTIFSILLKIRENKKHLESFDGYKFEYSNDKIKVITKDDLKIQFSNYIGDAPTKIVLTGDQNYFAYTIEYIK